MNTLKRISVWLKILFKRYISTEDMLDYYNITVVSAELAGYLAKKYYCYTDIYMPVIRSIDADLDDTFCILIQIVLELEEDIENNG